MVENDTQAQFLKEIEDGERFRFGKNWANFLKVLNEERIRKTEVSLVKKLGLDSLEGLRFLDIGSGSGLFSLAAKRLGAEVVSMDFDTDSVGCAEFLKKHYFPEDETWAICQGSALDKEFIEGLGSFDIVYSWGVLHHTGNMLLGLENAAIPVKPGGQLFVSIYNDQGGASRRWTKVKKIYASGVPGKLLISATYIPLIAIGDFLGNYANPARTYRYYRDYFRERGMSRWHDIIDWIGGYPFEVAKPEEIFKFYKDRGFSLTEMTTCGGGLGCNEYVFKRSVGDAEQ